MVECARLEIAYTGNRIKGSNPFVSARNYTASRYFLLNYHPFYDIIAHNNRTPTRPYFLSRPRDFFIYQKETNMKQPEFLTKLITSPAYADKNSDEFARATQYINLLYPGKINFDISGAMIKPKYDMTLEQFQTAQFKLDSDFESAKQEAEDEIQTEYGEYFENLGIDFDIDKYVIQPEIIAVKVLYPSGNIITRNLIIYDLDIPKFTKKTKIWRWHNEQSDSTCDECDALDETIFFNESDIPDLPAHPNCKCYITEDTLDDHGNTIKSKVYKTSQTTKTNTDDTNFDMAYEKLAEREGGYTEGTDQIDDEPTNMGITQTTLTNYSAKHPESNMPSDVKHLTPNQAREIYKSEYWDNTNIPQINNPRIRNAVFDMSVMSGPTIPTKTIQQTLNEQMNANLPETGYLGKQTITALNAIPDNKVNDFMKSLIGNRIESLQTMSNWPTAKGGWTRRTKSY